MYEHYDRVHEQHTWVKVKDLQVGDTVRAYGFPCIDESTDLRVHRDLDGIYVECRAWRHYIDCLIESIDDSLVYVGIVRVR